MILKIKNIPTMKPLYFFGCLFIIMLFLYLLALSMDVYRMQRQRQMGGTYAVRIFSYGWHSGLVLDYASIPAPYKAHFALWRKHRWIEISWGDDHFFRNQNPWLDWPLAIRAIAWPTKSVLHIVGFDISLEHMYQLSALQTFYVSKKNYLSLIRFISSFFQSDARHSFSVVGRGLYGDSYFLKSKGIYIFPFTCNVWTAKALKQIGFPLTPVLYQIPGLLMRVLRERGKKYPPIGKDVKYVQFILPERGNAQAY